MPIRTAVWKVAEKPKPLAESSLGKEQLLEGMITCANILIGCAQSRSRSEQRSERHPDGRTGQGLT